MIGLCVVIWRLISAWHALVSSLWHVLVLCVVIWRLVSLWHSLVLAYMACFSPLCCDSSMFMLKFLACFISICEVSLFMACFSSMCCDSSMRCALLFVDVFYFQVVAGGLCQSKARAHMQRQRQARQWPRRPAYRGLL